MRLRGKGVRWRGNGVRSRGALTMFFFSPLYLSLSPFKNLKRVTRGGQRMRQHTTGTRRTTGSDHRRNQPPPKGVGVQKRATLGENETRTDPDNSGGDIRNRNADDECRGHCIRGGNDNVRNQTGSVPTRNQEQGWRVETGGTKRNPTSIRTYPTPSDHV